MENTYKISANNNVFRPIVQYPARGLVFDRNEKLLVYNQPVYDVIVVPNELKTFDTTDFCKIVDITKQKLIEELNKAKKYSKFKQSIIIKLLSYEKFSLLSENIFKYRGFYTQTIKI